MNLSLPMVDDAEWLSSPPRTSVEDGPLPLAEILSGSLYYPASGLDGLPVKNLAGNVLSVVYVDQGIGRAELEQRLASPGFRGYQILGRRSLSQADLTPNGARHYERPRPEDGDSRRYADWMVDPYAEWIVFERQPEFGNDHGPDRFSLLYLAADGPAAYQALYGGNGVTAGAIAIIQPGTGFGGNWTDFRDPGGILARSVLNNPHGKPDILISGGLRGPDSYPKPDWPEYSEAVGHFAFVHPDYEVRIWRRPTWSAETDARTSDLLTGGSVPMLDFMPMKHADGRFGTVPLDYAISSGTGPVEVTVRRSGAVLRYPSLGALIAAGWAVD